MVCAYEKGKEPDGTRKLHVGSSVSLSQYCRSYLQSLRFKTEIKLYFNTKALKINAMHLTQ